MTVEELLQDLGITQVGSYDDSGSYIIDLQGSDEFGEIYTILDTSELEELDENSLLTKHSASLLYKDANGFQINLLADFDSDTYKLVINNND